MKLKVLLMLLLLLVGYLAQRVATAEAFDFETGNAPLEVVIPTVAPVIFTVVSLSGGDATLVLRVTTLVTNSWFDATAPYDSTAIGVYIRLGRRPPSEAKTNRNLNVAILYASYQVLNSLLPRQAQIWRSMLDDVGLDPDDDSTDRRTPVGIGNAAGMGVVRGRERDGMNQLGDEDGRTYNPMPYMDYTGYRPVNTAYRLTHPSRWQPDLQRLGMGIYKIQQFVTPQYALTEPYSYRNPRRFRVPPPKSSDARRVRAYERQAEEVLQASATWTTCRR